MLRDQSWSSVRVRWPRDRDEVLSLVKSLADAAAMTGQVSQMWLFGSYASGRNTAYSDADLCVVLRIGSTIDYDWLLRRFGEMAPDLELQLHVYDEETFNRMQASGSTFVREVMKGIRLL